MLAATVEVSPLGVLQMTPLESTLLMILRNETPRHPSNAARATITNTGRVVTLVCAAALSAATLVACERRDTDADLRPADHDTSTTDTGDGDTGDGDTGEDDTGETDSDALLPLDSGDETDAHDGTTDDLGDTTAEPVPRPYPNPEDWPPNQGPGAPTVSFSEDELFINCTTLSGGELDHTQHHNLLVMYDGYLLMPWAPEWGIGGISLYDISDPCAPVQVGMGYDLEMRETHSIGFWNNGDERWAVTNQIKHFFEGGIQFWDMSDISEPVVVRQMPLPGFRYPDAYARVVLSVFWQAPYVYAAGSDNGVYIIDASDPRNPELVSQYTFDPVLRVGQVQAVGNLLIVTAAEGARSVLLDISDPAQPQPIPGGDFEATDGDGVRRNAYFTNSGGGYIYYARKSQGGGLVIWDIRDPERPVYSGDIHTEGNGGYVFVKDHYAFVGESNFAHIYDISDHDDITIVARLHLAGDLDTITPIGNIAVLSVDDQADPHSGSAIAPWQTEPDTLPPYVTWGWPNDGAENLAHTTRVGVTFNEMVDVASAWEGSVRLYIRDTDPALTRVDGHISVQEHFLNFWPFEPLLPSTSYIFEIPAGGVVDYNGNAIVEPYQIEFRTVGE